MIPVARLNELFALSESGQLVRRTSGGNGRARIGAVAGTVNTAGYVVVHVDGKLLFAHRIAYAMAHGDWPSERLDHIDGDRANNLPANLRQVSNRTNSENQRKPQARNALGVLGVSRKRGKFRATIVVHGKQRSLGSHASPAEAHQAYVLAKRQLHEGNTL